MEISIDEWKQALEDAAKKTDDDGISADELSEAMRCSTATARKRLKKMIGAGLAYRVGTKWMTAIDGRSVPVPAYNIKVERSSGTPSGRSGAGCGGLP